MRIALIKHHFHPYGGAEGYVFNLAKFLIKKGHQVDVFSISISEETPKEIIFHPIRVIKHPSALRAIIFSFKVKQLLRKENFDIIHSFERTSYQDIYRAGDGCYKQWVNEIIENSNNIFDKIYLRSRFKDLILIHLEKRVCNTSPIIISNSKMIKKSLIRNYNIQDSKIKVIYNGVDLNKFHPRNKEFFYKEIRDKYNISLNEFLILFVGSGFRRKGLKYLLKGICILKDKPIKLLIVGQGRRKPYLKIIEKLNIYNKVIFAGTTKEIEKFYASADMLVLPSLYDAFSNVCLEAMASGIPVITSNKNGASEVVSQVDKGFILENPTDSFEIANKIEILFNSQFYKETKELSRNIAEKFPVEASFEKILQIYEMVKAKKITENVQTQNSTNKAVL